ncbi:MAG: Rrf2 family transcriptional regulator [bacterium]|nr:Rrf2 family transcriptional regulator [bacterium]
MKLSTKSYYGLRGLAHLAKEDGPCSVRKISREEGIPQKYLEKILQELKKAGLLYSKKGADGGYGLSQKPKTISVAKVVNVLEGGISTAPCLGKNRIFCRQINLCQEKGFWEKLAKNLDQALEKITLDQLTR